MGFFGIYEIFWDLLDKCMRFFQVIYPSLSLVGLAKQKLFYNSLKGWSFRLVV